MTAPRGLHRLARLHGIQSAYHDNEGRRVTASPESLMATLRALGVELDEAAGIPHRVAHRHRTLWERALEPVVVVWTPAERRLEGRAPGSFRLRTPGALRGEPVRVVVGLEEGGELRSSAEGTALELLRSAELGGVRWVERAVPLPALPTGYHDLAVEVGSGPATRRYRSTIIAAPERALGWDALPGAAERDGGARRWGLFAPLYALHERRADAPPTPTFDLLGRFAARAADAGASVIGTLPLLASFPGDASPYSPVSRLFWNELYVAPQGERGRAADAASPAVERYLDVAGAMEERRAALEPEARSFFGREGDGTGDGAAAAGAAAGAAAELAAFRARNPLADDYARFRAITESLGAWERWPDRLRARDVRAGDYDPAVAEYHLYVQLRAERQLAEVARGAEDAGVSLYLDLPMGVHPDGYDVWRERSLFALGARAGAPPDPLAEGGQDWGFPPLHPEASRLQGHRYFVACIRKHLRFARVLRVDHVMQLHRMYWIPGDDARDGVYVRYPAEELYAVLCLESHRAGAVIVGEDLGTVPRTVRHGMRRHGLPGMYVLEFELEERATGNDHVLVPRRVKTDALAAIGTHDTPTFAGWWWGEDIRIRLELGQLTEEEAERQLEGRREMREKLALGLGLEPPAAEAPGRHDEGGDGDEALALAVEERLLRRMGASDAGLVLATLEDLWLEREPQNVPGTMSERNWRRRSRRPLEALSDGPVAGLLDALDESRKGSQ